MLSITRLLYLIAPLRGEANAEHPQQVAIGCLDINVSLDHRLHMRSTRQYRNRLHITFGRQTLRHTNNYY